MTCNTNRFSNWTCQNFNLTNAKNRTAKYLKTNDLEAYFISGIKFIKGVSKKTPAQANALKKNFFVQQFSFQGVSYYLFTKK